MPSHFLAEKLRAKMTNNHKSQGDGTVKKHPLLMTNRWKLFALSVLATLFASVSHAASIVVTAPCINNSSMACATGITGLDVLGTLFDVTFSQRSYNDLFTVTPPYFLGDRGGASAAATAMTDVLKLPVIGYPNPSSAADIYVPYELLYGQSPSFVISAALVMTTPTTWFREDDFTIDDMGATLGSHGRSCCEAYYAVLVEAPAPATLALMGLGLAALCWSRQTRWLRT
jgi:hypothetical protein